MEPGGDIDTGFFGYYSLPAYVTYGLLINSLGNYSFPYTNVTMNFTAIPPGGCGVSVGLNPVSYPGAPAGIQTGKWWNIVASGSCTANITLPTNHLGFGADPHVCPYHTGSGTWDYGRTSSTFTTVTRNGVSTFSPFAVGDLNLGPVPVSVSKFEAE